jgi:hypothetical protein
MSTCDPEKRAQGLSACNPKKESGGGVVERQNESGIYQTLKWK